MNENLCYQDVTWKNNQEIPCLHTQIAYKHLYFHTEKGRTAASIFAGDSSFGDDSIEIIDIIIVSTVCTGDHLSLALSYPFGSSPGECKIEMQTLPSGYTFGCHISVVKRTVGGLLG